MAVGPLRAQPGMQKALRPLFGVLQLRLLPPWPRVCILLLANLLHSSSVCSGKKRPLLGLPTAMHLVYNVS